MSKYNPLYLLPLLIVFTTLACSANTPVGPALGGIGVAATIEEEPFVDVHIDEFSDLYEPESDETESPPFALSEGQPDWDAGQARPPLAETTPLTQEQIQDLLTRLPSLQEEEADVTQVRLPDQSLPPPRPGQEVDLPFPPPPSESPPVTQTDEHLSILRYAPEGDVPLAPQLSVTFSHPMVLLTSHGELAAAAIPVKLEPAVPGHWRWVGTRTLLFEADVDGTARMPMATEFSASVPDGLLAADGTKLAEGVSWTFRTPAPTLQYAWPTGGPHAREPVFFASFDQNIDPSAVIEHIQLTAQGHRYTVRRASQDDIAADSRVERLIARSAENRWLAFVSDEALPADTTVTVTFAPGTPSAEGPLVTAHPQSYSFRTPGPFVLRQRECAWGGAQCPPNTPLSLRFSNPIDTESFDPTLISIEPELDYVSYEVFGDSIWIVGNTKSRTSYDVTVAAGLTDRFGQSLSKDAQTQFRIGPMEAFLTAGSNGPITILDPYGKPSFPIYSVNLYAVNVRAYRVDPEQFVEYQQWRNNHWRDDQEDPPGDLVMERTLELNRQFDTLVETGIDLSDALDGDRGHLILYIEPEGGMLSGLLNRQLQDRRIISWVQVTEIGLAAFVDAEEMHVWANSLSDGAPLSDVAVNLWPQDVHDMTNATGTAQLRLPRNSSQLLIARRGDDVTFLPENRYEYYRTETGWNGWQQRQERADIRYYVFDDRKMYRPGETVSVKGWMRQIERDPEGDVSLLPEGAALELDYTVRDSRNNRIQAGRVKVNPLGGFHFQFDLPENANLGYAWIELRPAAGDEHQARYDHVIQIQEFRRPEYEVSAFVSEGPHIAGGHALATVSASYFAGGPLPSAEVNWDVQASEGSYDPPNWSEFVFGKWSPWWGYPGHSSYLGRASLNSRTDAAGQHVLRIDFQSADEGPPSDAEGHDVVQPFPTHIGATATVIDVNRQAWSSSAALLLHPADRYVGLRTARYFVEQGEPLSVEVVVTDIDGNAIEGHPADVNAALLGWEYREGAWHEVEKETQECALETTAASHIDDTENAFASCSFETATGGEYRITATVVDGEGRLNRTQLTRWVTGGQGPPGSNLEREDLQLIPDSEDYAPGDVAEILVQAPFYPAEGLLTLRRDGLVSSERFTMEGPTYTLHVPIEENQIPNVHVQVDLAGAGVRVDDTGSALPGLPRRPAYARGRLNLSIPPLSRTLRVDAEPREARLEPGAETTIDMTVLDADGAPVADAEFAVVVVDEAILALTGYQLSDPISVFYSHRGRGVSDHHNRADLVLASQQTLEGAAPSPTGTPQPMPTAAQPRSTKGKKMVAAAAPAAMADMAMEGEMAEESAADESDSDNGGQSIRARLNFDPLALFAPEVRTDRNGRASVTLTLPDNLTRYRVMVVAVAGGRYFGAGESNLTARLPLMVRPSAPRFLNFGDSFELPVVLQNQTDEAIETHVLVRAANALLKAESGVEGAAGFALTVPANDRVEVRFPTKDRQRRYRQIPVRRDRHRSTHHGRRIRNQSARVHSGDDRSLRRLRRNRRKRYCSATGPAARRSYP